MAGRRRHNRRVIGNALGELDANAGNLSETSRKLKVPISTLWTWRESYKSDPIVEKYRNLKNEELADRFRVMSALAIERLVHEINEVSTDKLATVAAIGADKQLLLTGQPTEITANADRRAFLIDELKRLRQRCANDNDEYSRNYYRLQTLLAEQPDFDPANPQSLWRDVPAELLPAENATEAVN